MLILGGFSPFYYNVVYHKLIYIHYYPFFSMMLIFFNKYISSWCLEPLLLFVVHRWSGGRIFKKKNFFTPCSCFTPFYYLLSFQCTHWQKQMFYIFCLIEVNMASDQLTPHTKNVNTLPTVRVGVVSVFLLKRFCGT